MDVVETAQLEVILQVQLFLQVKFERENIGFAAFWPCYCLVLARVYCVCIPSYCNITTESGCTMRCAVEMIRLVCGQIIS